GAFKIVAGIVPKIYERKEGKWDANGQKSEWVPVEDDPIHGLGEAQMSVAAANKRVTDDWLEAIAQKREPVCSGYAGMKALEMAMAVFVAGLSRHRVEFPLKQREHPLGPGRGVKLN